MSYIFMKKMHLNLNKFSELMKLYTSLDMWDLLQIAEPVFQQYVFMHSLFFLKSYLFALIVFYSLLLKV